MPDDQLRDGGNAPDSMVPLPDPRRVGRLKIIVITLGVLIIFCVLVMLGTIVYRLSHSRIPPPHAEDMAITLHKNTSPPSGSGVAGCPDTSASHGITDPTTAPASLALTLPNGWNIDHIALDNGQLAVHLTGPSGDRIVIIDIRQGAVTNRIDLKHNSK
ncbi:MAG: hypothetical protein V6Z86_00460 [Hyphomicrobiales bacterium]